MPKEGQAVLNTRSRKSSVNDSGGPSLPWWVELLFVQVGLPDGLLRRILKTKKRLSSYKQKNKKPIAYTLIALALVIYFQPLTRQAKYHNQCVASSKVFISKQPNIDSNPSESELQALANRFCNGGSL